MLEERAVDERRRDPAERIHRAEHADEGLRELKAVGHVEIERRVDAGTEVIKCEKERDHPEAARSKRAGEACETLAQASAGDCALFFVDEDEARGGYEQRHDSGNRSGGVYCREWREPFD